MPDRGTDDHEGDDDHSGGHDDDVCRLHAEHARRDDNDGSDDINEQPDHIYVRRADYDKLVGALVNYYDRHHHAVEYDVVHAATNLIDHTPALHVRRSDNGLHR